MLQPTSSADEIDRIPPHAIFVSQDLFPLGEEAVRRSSKSTTFPVYRLSVPAAVEPDQNLAQIPTLDDLIEATKDLHPMQKTPLAAGEATRRVAYYCTTSGTSGFQVILYKPPSFVLY
jgi:hypothetical protein